jgi:hypothetical protein
VLGFRLAPLIGNAFLFQYRVIIATTTGRGDFAI